MNQASELVRLPEVKRLSGLSRSTIYRLEARGAFPSRVRISERATGWYLRQVLAWIEERPRASGNAPLTAA